MKRSKLYPLAAAVLALLLLAGCGTPVKYSENMDRYVKTVAYEDGFTILQLTDIHWSSGSQIGNRDYGCRKYLHKVIDEAVAHAGKIDLIEVTGDTFMLANKATVREFIDLMTEVNIPYAMTWGNHDREGEYDPAWLSRQFLNAPNCLYTEVENDDVHGLSNYVINLTKEDGSVAWQLAQLDSGASYREGAADLFLDYDFIRDDQVAWFTAQHDAVGAQVPVLAYYHIAQSEMPKMFEEVTAGNTAYKSNFFKLEGFAESAYCDDLYDEFKAAQVKGVFIGHSHANDWTCTTPDGIVYGFGVKSGEELYYGIAEPDYSETTLSGFTVEEPFNISGASLVTLTDTEGHFDLEHLYLNERDDGDFVMWVKY